MSRSEAGAVRQQEPEQLARARGYQLLAQLLGRPPGQELLAELGRVVLDETDSRELVRAWAALRLGAGLATPESVAGEYQSLFVGLGRGELVPYGSWYLSGFLMERPLARLRNDLARLGFERDPDCGEPEDHAAALCEVMGMLVLDQAVSFEVERDFFQAHLAPWMGRFFEDLQEAESASFYRPVGLLGAHFLDLERRYFTMLV